MSMEPKKGTQGVKDGFQQIFSQQHQIAVAAIEQRTGRFFLRFVAGAQAVEGLPAADTILRPQERALLPEPRGEWERHALKRPTLLKKDYLNAQLCDIVEEYGEGLRMVDGPAVMREELDAHIALFIEQTQCAMRERLRLALLREEPAYALVQDLCGLFEKNAQVLDGHARRCYRQAGWHRALQAAAPSGTLFRVYAEGGEGSCKACLSRSGRTYTLEQLEREGGLPPYHPHCRCVILPDYTAAGAAAGQAAAAEGTAAIRQVAADAMGEGAGGTVSPEAGQRPDYGQALRRIPADARRMLEEMLQAQRRRLTSKTVSGLLDWLTFGIVSGFWNGLQSRTNAMMEEPNLYTISNWLTLGLVELGKEAIFPDEPLSLQHWLSALGFASSAFEVYRVASRNGLLSRMKLGEKKPQKRPSWRQSEIDIGKEHPDYQAQKSFLNGKEVPYGTKGSVRPDFYKKGHSIEVKNYNLKSVAGQKSMVKKIKDQFMQRAKHLPAGTKQKVIIDIRGQNIPYSTRWRLYKQIRKQTHHQMAVRFKVR